MATAAELQKQIDDLEALKAQALIAEATPTYNRVISDLTASWAHFSAEQRKAIVALVSPSKATTKGTGKITTPKYLLNGVPWAGRGKTPTAYEAWKKNNPNKDYPLNPEWVAKQPKPKAKKSAKAK